MKKWMTLFFLGLSFCSYANKVIETETIVLNMLWEEADKSYDVELRGFAAHYNAKKDVGHCLSTSIKNRQAVKLVIDPYSLEIKSCKN